MSIEINSQSSLTEAGGRRLWAGGNACESRRASKESPPGESWRRNPFGAEGVRCGGGDSADLYCAKQSQFARLRSSGPARKRGQVQPASRNVPVPVFADPNGPNAPSKANFPVSELKMAIGLGEQSRSNPIQSQAGRVAAEWVRGRERACQGAGGLLCCSVRYEE